MINHMNRIQTYEKWQLSEAAKPKPAEVIVKSLQESPAAAGLRALKARPKSVGQHRVVITGIPDRVVETQEHPDNPFYMWRSYRKRPSRFDSIYSEKFFPTLDALWKDMWENVIKNMSGLNVPGKRNLDTVPELAAKGVDHTSGLGFEDLKKALVDWDKMPDSEAILAGLKSLEDGGWTFKMEEGINVLTLEASTPENLIQRAFNLPLKGVEIQGSVSPRVAYFTLSKTLHKGKRWANYMTYINGDDEEIVKAIRRNLDARMKIVLEMDWTKFEVNGELVPGIMKKPFDAYVDTMTKFLRTLPIDAYGTSDGAILAEAKRFFRSEEGSVVLAFLDDRYGMEPNPKALASYRSAIADEFENDPQPIERFFDELDDVRRKSVFGPDLIPLIKSKKLII